MEKSNCRAVIFDLDGVIVTTDYCHYLAWKKMADDEGIYFDRSINERLRGISRMESLDIILERAQKNYSDSEKKQLATKKNDLYVQYISKLTSDAILAGVNENLAKLKALGIKIAIGSSSKNASIILKQIGLDCFFDAVVDGNNIQKSKPDPEVFLKAAEILNVSPSECLVVEDADAGIDAAKSAGMMALGVGSAHGGDFYSSSLNNFSIAELLARAK